MFSSSWYNVCDEGIEALRSILKWGTLPVMAVSETTINSLVTNMENIGTVLTEEAIGKNIRSLEVQNDVDGDSVHALCDILERTKFLNCLNIKDTVCKDSVTLK